MPLIVVEKAGTSLFALDWINAFQVDVNALLYHNTPTTLPSTIDCNVIEKCDRDLHRILDQYPAVFSPGLGLCTKVKPLLLLKEDAVPKCVKPRPVLLSHMEAVDMSDAYLQVELDDATKKLLVVNTHKGLFRYNRLSFGSAPAPAIFQKLVDNLVSGIPYVAAYLDDVIVTGRTKQEHLQNLKQVLAALDEYGMKLRFDKCEFFKHQVTYLGHVISADGLKPSEVRIDAIVKIPTPENVKQLESFIGKLNYYGKFLPSFSTICAPLNRLRKQDVEWDWSADCDQAFSQLKVMLAQKTRLVHCDPTKPITLAADASSYGIGAAISQCAPDGTEEPIAFASKTLTSTEKNYGQEEKEPL